MASEFVTKIPADQLGDCKSWLLPEVSSKKIIPASTEKSSLRHSRQATDKHSASQQSTAEKKVDKHPSHDESIEIIETVNDIDVQAITADQLQAITESAEKEGFDSGYKKGFDEAREQGYQDGLKAAKEKIAEHTERLQHITDALLIPLEHEQQALEQQVLDIICRLTTAVVKRELQLDSSLIIDVVKQSLKILPSMNNQLTLYLNSQDIELIKEVMNDKDKHGSYKVDDNLLPGGCRLETDETSVDHSIEHSLQQVLDDFLNKRYVNQDAGVDSVLDNASSVQEPTNREEKDKAKNNTENNVDSHINNDVENTIEATKVETTKVDTTKVGTNPTDKPIDNTENTSSSSIEDNANNVEKKLDHSHKKSALEAENLSSTLNNEPAENIEGNRSSSEPSPTQEPDAEGKT